MERFGKTLLFLFLVLIFIMGAKLALRVALPAVRQISTSLADAIQSS